jgi:hypothetical protein
MVLSVAPYRVAFDSVAWTRLRGLPEPLQHGCIVQPSKSGSTGLREYSGGLCPQRSCKPNMLSGPHRQAGVFLQQRDMGSGSQITGNGTAHAVGADPALSARLLDHIQRQRGIQPHALCQRQCLGRAHQVDARQQVVDQLGARRIAHPLADPKHPRRQVVQQRLVLIQHGAKACDHEAHAAVSRPCGAP